MTGPESNSPQILHATSVALNGRAAVLTGASGSGKSALALELMARGAALIADDRTLLRATPDGLIAGAPDSIAGLIEARFVGLLAADPAPPAQVALVIDLDRVETDRLPPHRHTDLLGHSVPLLYRADGAHFAASIIQYLKAGRVE